MNLFEIITSGASSFILVCLVFFPLERLLPLRSEQRIFRRRWQTDLIHVFATGFLIRVATIFLISLAVFYLQSFVPASFRVAIAAQPVWLAFVEVLVIADLGFYLVHRAFHAIPCLWRFHAIHHSIEEMDFLAAHRVHPIDQILTRGATLIPAFLLGFALEAILLFGAVYQWQAVLIHSNVRIKFGPLRWIVASPAFHHWHHANCPAAIDKNFAGQLPVIDFLFGTIYLPRGEAPQKYGIDEPVPASYLSQLTYPFKRPILADFQLSKDVEVLH